MASIFAKSTIGESIEASYASGMGQHPPSPGERCCKLHLVAVSNPWPKATNRRVLAPYRDSMLDLLKNGYKAKLRPSGHDISEKFGRDNGGSVPPIIFLAIANTSPTDVTRIFAASTASLFIPHVSPKKLPEYFIRLLTDPGDLVLDPFAGSCMTGAVAERLGRKWVCCGLDEEYLKGALARFEESAHPPVRSKSVTYELRPPCQIKVDDKDAPLAKDGGRVRPSSSKEYAKTIKISGRSAATRSNRDQRLM